MDAPRGRILLVEDDVALGSSIEASLARAGHLVTWARDAQSARKHLEERPYDLVLLDLMLPDEDGFGLLARWRSEGRGVPVLIVSARVEANDRVRGLRLGADDYLTKPFWPEELLARVEARLRRAGAEAGSIRRIGSLQVDLAARSVSVEGRAVALTRVEFEVLAALARQPGRALSRAALADAADLGLDLRAERRLDVHVSRIRKKLGSAAVLLETVWGVGYRLSRGEPPPSSGAEDP